RTPKPGGERPAARPGYNPFASSQGMPRPGQRAKPGGGRGGQRDGGPRPGNNPFATSQGMPRPGQRPAPQRDGQSGGGGGQGREGGPRPGMPTPGIMRQHSHGGLA